MSFPTESVSDGNCNMAESMDSHFCMMLIKVETDKTFLESMAIWVVLFKICICIVLLSN